jgi:hypothetical protein
MKDSKPVYSARILKLLEKLHKKLPKKTDPLIRGCLVVMDRVCGQKSCRCTKGYKHRSLYLAQSNKGKSRLVYIPKSYEQLAKLAVTNHRKAKSVLERLSRIHLLRLKNRGLSN